MVNLMLENARQPTLRFELGWLAMPVQALHLYRSLTLHFADQVGDGQTAFHTHQGLFGALYNLWVDHNVELFRLDFASFIIFFTVLYNDQSFRDIDLRRGQADAGSFAHGL